VGCAVTDKDIEQIALRAATLAAEKVLAGLKAGNLGPVAMWLDTQTAAKYLGVSESYLCSQCTKGKGPKSIKRGRHRRFKEAWLDAWLIESTESTR